MSLLRVEGFDHQNTAADLTSEFGAFVWRQASGVSFSAYGSGIGNIGKSIIITTGYLIGVFTTPLVEAYIGMYLQTPSSPIQAQQFSVVLFNSNSGQNPLNSTPTGQIQIVFNMVNGTIAVYRGVLGNSPSLLVTSSNNTFSNNAAFSFEIHAKIETGGTGVVTLYVNGAQVATFGGSTATDGNNIFDSVLLGASYNFNPGAGGTVIDHMYFEDTVVGPGSLPFNTFVGPAQVYTLFPNSAGASTQYTPAASTNVSQVQETAMDSDTTYNFNSTVGNEDLFNIQSLPAGVSPVAVQTSGAYRQDSAGTRGVANLLKSGASTFAGAGQTLNTAYTYQHDVYPQNPTGSVAWTISTVNALEIGYETVS